MDKFKEFYNEKKGKYILFFGFYLIFFIFLGIYMRSIKDNKVDESNKNNQNIEEKLTSYNISNLINNDYYYTIDIIDNSEINHFSGKKNNIDYGNYEYKYFLDIYNINQLLKRSKLIDSTASSLTYELKSSELNDILLTDKKEANNKIIVYVDNMKVVNKIVLDLTNYLEKARFQITINYTLGEKNENSIS